jgi:hypothetical protein
MGTFGICDYLSRRNIPVKLLNLALYKEAETRRVLEHHLESFRPTHVGVIFHWQETAEGFLRVGEIVKSCNRDIRIISGGFTAGYFSEDLLEKCGFLDFVIKGDPEKPLELLLNSVEPSEIPNLIYRSASGIRSNEASYLIDQKTLSGISFSGLYYLYNYDLYLDAIDKKLGFPVFIGRGCVHGCRYCGGSREAFRLHCARVKPMVRTIQSVIEDLKRLKDFTRTIYICYEIDRDYIKALFGAIREEESLIKTFRLNYGAWRLLDEKFLNLYENLFILSSNLKPVFELSPEVFDDEGRRRIKNGSVYYSIGELKENIDLINSHLGDSINISVFFSRYHDTAKTYSDMKKELSGIFRLKHDLLRKNITNTNIFYDHLSTDVASRYWEEYVKHPAEFDTLVSAIGKLKARARESFPADNLCVFIPQTLSEGEIFRCELLIFILKTLEKYSHEMFHIMFKCLDELMIDIFEEIIIESYSRRSDNAFGSFDHRELLNALKQRVAGDKSLLERIPFIEDLINLNIRKIGINKQPLDLQPGYQTVYPKLNHDLISIHGHDYLDLQNFLKRLDDAGVKDLKLEKTVYIFLIDEILSMTHETFRLTLKEFEKDISVDDYYELMKKKGILTPSYHKDLVNKLTQSGVLVYNSSSNTFCKCH